MIFDQLHIGTEQPNLVPGNQNGICNNPAGLTTSLRMNAVSTGRIAFEVLAQKQTARIMGLTSRGLFLSVGPDRIVFLSFEKYRGPLTINLNQPILELQNLVHNEKAVIFDGSIIFPNNIAVIIEPKTVWQSDPVVNKPCLFQKRRRRFQTVVRDIFDPDIIFCNFHLGFPESLDSSSDNLTFSEKGQNKHRHLGNRISGIPFLYKLINFLGSGPGLTPEMDDFILGVLLTLNRWGSTLHPLMDLKNINKRMVISAYSRTTCISANLIECATKGEADERVLRACDAIARGSKNMAESLLSLLDWGATSGASALFGMAVVLVGCLPRHLYDCLEVEGF